MGEDIHRRIIEENLNLHEIVAPIYDSIRGDIFNRHEQTRLSSALRRADSSVNHNTKKALDFGAGTGNVTKKLVDLGYHVTAVDLSAEMLGIMKKKYPSHFRDKQIIAIAGDIESIELPCEGFSMITVYSVLHHLPDYSKTIRKLASLLSKGGIMFIDHEPSPYVWHMSAVQAAFSKVKIGFDYFLNMISRRKLIRGVNLPTLDYSWADYWSSKEHHVDHELVQCTFEDLNFESVIREDYYLHRTDSPNPIFPLYREFCRPDTSLWIARK